MWGIYRREKDGREHKEEQQELKQQRGQKLVGLISKTDILNVAKERDEFDKAVKKLSASSSTNNISTDRSNFRKTTIALYSAISPYHYPSSYDKNNYDLPWETSIINSA